MFRSLVVFSWGLGGVLGASSEGHSSVFNIGEDVMTKDPIQVGALLIFIVLFSVFCEVGIHWLRHSISEVYQQVVDIISKEIMILGLISMMLFVMTDSGAIHDLPFFDVHIFELIHMAIFLVALLYIVAMLFLLLLTRAAQRKWVTLEGLRYRPAEDQAVIDKLRAEAGGSGGDGGGGGNNGDYAPRMIDEYGEKLKSIVRWREAQVGWRRILVILDVKKVYLYRKYRRGVRFHKMRKYFIMRSKQLIWLRGKINDDFHFARYLRKSMRSELVLSMEIGWPTWLVLAVVVGINTLRTALQYTNCKVGACGLGDDDDGGHRRLGGTAGESDGGVEVDLFIDFWFYTGCNYFLAALLYLISMHIDKVYTSFLGSTETRHDIEETLELFKDRPEIPASKLAQMREVYVREATRGVSDADADQQDKSLQFAHSQQVFQVVKTTILFNCWFVMLFILVFSRTLYFHKDVGVVNEAETQTSALRAVFTIATFAPVIATNFFLLPELLPKMSVVLGAGELNSPLVSAKAIRRVDETNFHHDSLLAAHLEECGVRPVKGAAQEGRSQGKPPSPPPLHQLHQTHQTQPPPSRPQPQPKQVLPHIRSSAASSASSGGDQSTAEGKNAHIKRTSFDEVEMTENAHFEHKPALAHKSSAEEELIRPQMNRDFI